MNTNIINAELALALRKCLPFVRKHAIVSGGDGSRTYAFAMRALADAETRQREQEAVKNIVAAEQAQARALQRVVAATLDHAHAFGAVSARKVLDRFGVRNVKAARPEQHAGIERAMNMSPSDLALADEKGISPFNTRFPTAGWISGQEAKNKAARAVRPMPPSPVGGYAPATPPAKNCTCDTCTRYRRGETEGAIFFNFLRASVRGTPL